MTFIVEFSQTANRDFTARLTPRSNASGVPAASYTPLETSPGVYRFSLSEALGGEFDLNITSTESENYPTQYLLFSSGTDGQTVSATAAPQFSPLDTNSRGITSGNAGVGFNSRTIVESEITSTTGCTDPSQQGAYILPAGSDSAMSWTLQRPDGTIELAIDPILLEPHVSTSRLEVGGEFGLLDEHRPSVHFEADFSLPAAAVEFGVGAQIHDLTQVDPDRDLSVFPTRLALFRNPFCAAKTYAGRMQIRDGKILIVPPEEVLRNPGIYAFEFRWTQDGETFDGTSVVSVEQSLINAAASDQLPHGPLRLSQIRRKLRDYTALNDVLAAPEFSTEEIVQAMLEPIEYFNEVPPHVLRYTPSNFPYRLHWLDATVARLLQTAGLWMQRNQVTIKGEGISADERSKFTAILKYSAIQWDRYEKFVHTEKSRHNASRAYGIIG